MGSFSVLLHSQVLTCTQLSHRGNCSLRRGNAVACLHDELREQLRQNLGYRQQCWLIGSKLTWQSRRLGGSICAIGTVCLSVEAGAHPEQWVNRMGLLWVGWWIADLLGTIAGAQGTMKDRGLWNSDQPTWVEVVEA